MFVFSGLALIRKDKSYVNDDVKMVKRNAAWDAVNAGKMDLALSSWSSSYVVHQPDLIHLVIRILKENNIDYMRAPYGAGAQVCVRNHRSISLIRLNGNESCEHLTIDANILRPPPPFEKTWIARVP